MMQIQLFILGLIFSLLNIQENDTIGIPSFYINGEKYWFGGFNQVYKLNKGEVSRIDKSLDSRISTSAYVFKHNDTVIKFGGYGYWSQRNFLYYFDFKSLEWEYYQSIDGENIKGSFFGLQNQDEDKIIFYGGKTVNTKNRLEQIPSQEIVEYDFNNRQLKNIGSLKFDVLSKKTIYKSNDFDMVVDSKYLYIVNSLKNKVTKYNRPRILDFIKKIEYDKNQNVFSIIRLINKTGEFETVSLKKNLLGDPIDEFDLYKKNENVYFFIYIFLLFLVLVGILIVKIRKYNNIIIYKNVIKFKGNNYEFESQSIEFISLLLKTKKLEFNTVFNIFSNPNLTYAHNTRITNKNIEEISLRLKSIFSLKKNPIQKLHSTSDKRQKIIVASDELLKLKKVIKQ